MTFFLDIYHKCVLKIRLTQPVAIWLNLPAPFRRARRKCTSWRCTDASLSVLLSKDYIHWWKHEAEAVEASLLFICPVHVASSHLHQTQRLCGSLAFVWSDSTVLELLKPQTCDNSRFHGEIQEGDRNPSSLSCSRKKAECGTADRTQCTFSQEFNATHNNGCLPSCVCD